MERYTKRITCICLCCLIIALNIKVARAEAVPNVMCGSATVADCVMSYYAMSGAAVANTDWINTLYNDLGSNFGTIYDFAENGMLTLNADGTWQATTALETAIENAPAYQSLGLDQVFNVSSAEVAAGGGLAAASGGSILGGALGCTASVGVLPLLGGVTAAYWGGIGLGTIISHCLGLYGDKIYDGQPITFNDQQLSSIVGGMSSYATAEYRNNSRINIQGVRDSSRVIYLGYQSGTSLFTHLFIFNRNLSNQGVTVDSYIRNTDGSSTLVSTYTYTLNDKGVCDTNISGTYFKSATPIKMFPSQEAYNSYVSSFESGVVYPAIKSPDLIGSNGNLEASKENGGITVPDMLPQVDPSVQSGQPLSLQDWLNFANSAHQNTSTGALPDNSALFQNMVDLIKKAIPNPNPNPNPNPDPYTPPNPTPSPDPDYDPNPDNPNQPDYESERESQTEPVPDNIPTGAPWITDGLLDKFPFCIPKDMIDMVKNFSSGTRQAPYISWRFNPPNTPVDYTFNLDLSDFEEIATLLRLLELGVFIVGLAFATRYLIGAT